MDTPIKNNFFFLKLMCQHFSGHKITLLFVNYPMRWNLIKHRFSRALPKNERISASRQKKGERDIWQRRYWEHLIRDDEDFEHHVNYIHFNPVKHGYVRSAVD